MLSIDRSLSPFSRQPSPLPSPRSPRFQTSACKTRMIGLSHWMAPCNEIDVVRAMLDHSEPFNPCRKAFHELKTMLRLHNSLPPTLTTSITTDTDLKHLLPDRSTCDRWCAQYQTTYGRIYTILDPKALTTDIDRIYSGDLSHPVHVSKLLLAMAIAMQLSPTDRLYGRSLARQVEIFLHSSSRFQKPCIGVVQVHLLLIVLKTISASDTDKIYDLMGLHGITSQIVLNMGLHRNPALFADVSPYHAEVRKRLWWSFVRLNVDYCVRSGTQFTLRLEESDCPLPTTAGLRALDGTTTSNTILTTEPDEQARADLAFGIAAARLARVIGPMQQALYSSKAEASDPGQMMSELRVAYEDIVASLPASLQASSGSGSQSSDPVKSLQQSMLSITLHSFLTVIKLASTLSIPTHPSQRPSLMEIWDSSTSVFHQFQSLCQSSVSSETTNMACHLLWTDACRAVLSACWTVSRLRELDQSSHPQRTVHVFQQILTEALTFLSGMWTNKFHLGSVAAKTSIILAVTLNVTLNNSLDQRTLMGVGVATAENLVAEFTQALALMQREREGQHRQPTHSHTRSTPMSDMELRLDPLRVPLSYSPASAPLSSPDLESVAGSIYGSWTASTSSNNLLVPPTSSGASSMVGTPSLTTHEYFDLDFSAAEQGFDLGLSTQDSLGSPAYGYQVGGNMQQPQEAMMYGLNPCQGMEGMNGMNLWH